MGKRGDESSSVSDEEWAEFVRKAQEDGGRGAPKEPSAAARAARKPRAAEPEGWRTGPAWQEMNGGRTRKRRWAASVGVLLALGLAVVAVRPELVTDRLPGGWGTDGQAAPPAAETARPTGAPPEELFPDEPTLKEPFRGSPAAAWEDGAAGIHVPEAKAVGGMTKEQVAHALTSTKQLLVAANLDPATLRGERPTAALELLDPLQADGRRLIEKALTAPSAEQNPLWAFSRFDPSEVRPAGAVVKTRGRMTYEKGDRDGEVLVHADYTFVYPVVRARPGATEVARTVVRREMTFALYDPAKIRTTPGKLYVLRWLESAGNDDCTRDGDGFLHPQFASELPPTPTEAPGPSVDPYDRSKPLADRSEECGTVTRT
ncbi:hypothetical protein AB0A69_16670 [Streptomyces sp. NPDC045431]|uniref:hypothetical protein n=1 Tax=Streptomyces sp. NPDC045431 TaxID=3155613 RepID=UPI00340E10BB